MNDLLKQRIAPALDALSDERGYQILDYIEFLDSKYAERARPGGILAKITETVEDTMRAGKLPIQAISGTMGLMDSAAKVMKGLAAAGQAVVDEAVKAAEDATKRPPTVAPPIELEPTVESCHPERSEGAISGMVPFTSSRRHGSLTAQRRGDMAAPAQTAPKTAPSTEFIRGIGPLAAISLVVGSMIGSGIFIVSADISRQVSPWGPGGLLLVWIITGADDRDRRAGLCRAGGDDAEGRRTVRVPPGGPLAGRGVPLRLDPLRRHPDRHHRRGRGGVRPVPERAGAGGQSRRLPAAGTAPPARRARRHPARPLAAARRGDPLDRCSSPGSTSAGSARRGDPDGVHRGQGRARSRCWCCCGLTLFRQPDVAAANFADFWGTGDWTLAMIPVVGAAMVGSLFSSDAWNNVTFAAAEVQNPSRNLPLALAMGTGLVSLLYILTNVAYLNVLPFYGDPSGHDVLARGHPARGAGPGRHRGHRGRARCGRGGGDGGRDPVLDLRLQQRADPRRSARLLRHGARPAVLRAGRRAPPRATAPRSSGSGPRRSGPRCSASAGPTASCWTT